MLNTSWSTYYAHDYYAIMVSRQIYAYNSGKWNYFKLAYQLQHVLQTVASSSSHSLFRLRQQDKNSLQDNHQVPGQRFGFDVPVLL